MKLIGTTTSPYVRKVRVVLAEKKLEYEFVQKSPWIDNNTLHTFNPLGKVPCLVLIKPESVLYDSRVIVEYLDTLSPVCRLIYADGRERLEVKIWEALVDGVADAAIAAMLEKTWDGRNPEERCTAWIQRQLNKVQAGLAEMERLLGEKQFCVGKQFSLADIAAIVLLDWLDLRFPEIAWRNSSPNLSELHERMSERASFVDTMPIVPQQAKCTAQE